MLVDVGRFVNDYSVNKESPFVSALATALPYTGGTFFHPAVSVVEKFAILTLRQILTLT